MDGYSRDVMVVLNGGSAVPNNHHFYSSLEIYKYVFTHIYMIFSFLIFGFQNQILISQFQLAGMIVTGNSNIDLRLVG